MNPFRVIVVPEAILLVFIAGTWWWVLRQRNSTIGRRHRASLAGLVLPTLALFLELLVATIVSYYGSLQALDEAAATGSWSSVVDYLTLGLSIAAGLLPLCGLVLAIAGKGSLRILGVIWSCIVLCTFFVNLVLAVNSFH